MTADNNAPLLSSKFQLPAKPQALADLQDEVAKESPSIQVFADIIASDVALSSSVLKMVNSPAFGLKRPITDIKQSVVLLGYSQVTNLVSFFQLQNSFTERASISLEQFWDTAMDTANMIKLALKITPYTFNCLPEDAYAFGLFRDCGIPLMAIKYPDYKDVLIEANRNPELIFTDVEDKYYETNHTVLGYYMSRSWKLPKQLSYLIQDHHKPDYLNSQDGNDIQKELYSLAKIASNALSRFKSNKDDPEWFLVKESVLEFLLLSTVDYQQLEDELHDAFEKQQS